jgi:segregation and condensation protein A
MAGRASARAEQFPRGWVPPPPDPLPPEVVIDLEEVVRAVEEIIEGMPQPVIHRVVPRPLDVEGATARIRAILGGRERVDFRELVGERPHVSEVISVLIALLELARLGEARLTQAKPFEDLKVIGEPSHEAG